MESVRDEESRRGSSLVLKVEAQRQSRPKDVAISLVSFCTNRWSGSWYCFLIFYESPLSFVLTLPLFRRDVESR